IFCLVPKKLLSEFMGKNYFIVAQRRKYIVITNQPLGMNETDKITWAGCQTLSTPGLYLKSGGI
ncbi:MAG: hypothetical protein J7J46_06970, partial [Candidatus Desulfofervidus sp.]|nr:hypothetical protein [Candidatus Desulfofervidus sp.]